MQSNLTKNVGFWEWQIDKLVTYRMKIILMASWALPDLIFLTCSLLKKNWKLHVHHSWRSWDEKSYMIEIPRHDFRHVIGNTFCILLQEVYKWLYTTLGAFPLQLTLPMQRIQFCRQRLGDSTSIAEMSSCSAQARWVVYFVQPLFEHVGGVKQRFLESYEF